MSLILVTVFVLFFSVVCCQTKCIADLIGFTLVSKEKVDMGQYNKVTEVWERDDSSQCDDNDDKTTDIFQQTRTIMISVARHTEYKLTCQCLHRLSNKKTSTAWWWFF